LQAAGRHTTNQYTANTFQKEVCVSRRVCVCVCRRKVMCVCSCIYAMHVVLMLYMSSICWDICPFAMFSQKAWRVRNACKHGTTVADTGVLNPP